VVNYAAKDFVQIMTFTNCNTN